MRVLPLLWSAVLVTLAGCMDRGEYPSLKPRAFEIAARNAAPDPPPLPAAPARAEVVARVATLLAQGEDGRRAFAAELDRARQVVAAAGVADSESWITAQEAVSGLEASRTPTVTALAELDALNLTGVDTAGLRFGENDFAAIRAASERLDAIVDAQQREVAGLQAQLVAP